MLGRRQSIRGEQMLLDYALEDPLNQSTDIEWINKKGVQTFLNCFALLSLISVSANTPRTFEMYPILVYVTLICDLVVTVVFSAEMIYKMYSLGIIRGTNPYLKDRWCQYDAVMVFFHWVSIVLHVFQLMRLVDPFKAFSIMRAPRPLIVGRLFKVYQKLFVTKGRLTSIIKRSSQQISNVTRFFVFFLSLYGLLGVQLFGDLRSHCVVDTGHENESSVITEISLGELAIPDTFCSRDANAGYQCPKGMVCRKLNLESNVTGFSGFSNFVTSIFTVYQASSQEGWVFIMYTTIDSLPAWRSTFFFTTMIFFLSWLVKNVFIAVITEAFNELRVQFQKVWGVRGQIPEQGTRQILAGNDCGWHLTSVNDSKTMGWAPHFCTKYLQSAGFYLLIMAAIITNASWAASLAFNLKGGDRQEIYRHYYYGEIAYTIFFDLEALLKLWCLGFNGYFRLTIHKFEFVLALGTTIRLIPNLFMSCFTFFQVLRLVRLIKASPVLEDFVYKIFGPGKKLGSLIIFTLALLIITSSISMQLFCFLDGVPKFATFPMALMSMFQILTQEGWVEVMDETMISSMRNMAKGVAPFVAMYFIMYHLFVTLIVLSLFVAVILDNLELDEDFKKLKQMKTREQSAGIQETLPLRLRVFEKFPNRPTMAKLHKVPSDFSLPNVRESFMRQYLEEETEEEDVPLTKSNRVFRALPSVGDLIERPILPFRKRRPVKMLTNLSFPRNALFDQKKMCISNIISEANNQRILLGDSGQIPPPGKGPHSHGTVTGKHVRIDQKSNRRSLRGSIKMKQHHLEHLKENGDIASMNRSLSSRKPHDIDIKLLQAKRQQAEMRRTQCEEDLRENHPYFDTPLFAVGRESKFRMFCQYVVYSRYDTSAKDPITGKERKMKYKRIRNLLGLVSYLDWVMILVTTVSCSSMMLETYEYRVMEEVKLQIAEYLFVVFMSLELTLKILADGLLFTPKALIKDMAGILDLFIYMVSLVFICWMPKKVSPQSGAHLLMVLRCLRPLRIFNLVPHMRKVVSELVKGFKEILLVSVLLIVLLFVFASYGVQLYGGFLARCNDETITEREKCHGVFMRSVFITKMKLNHSNMADSAILVPRVWSFNHGGVKLECACVKEFKLQINPLPDMLKSQTANPRRFNFDNIGNAMLALFEVLSFKGWLDIRDVLIKRLGTVSAMYIHLFIFLGSMIGLTLFVGVVIANYSENKGTALLTVDQRRWCDLKKRLKIAQPLHLPPRPEGGPFRAFIYDITQHIYFKRSVAAAVLLNSGLLFVTWNEELESTKFLVVVSSLLNLVFVAEVFMKMIGFSPRGYWQSRRNCFDLFVTVMGVVWIVLTFTIKNDYTHMMGVMVIILRFFTITGKHPTLKMLMLTVVVSVYKSFFIITGMFLLILSYAFAGALLFGTVKSGEGIGRRANFKTALGGITLLFRIVTGEDWNKIMHDCMVAPPYCTLGENYWQTNCGNFTCSLIFFCSFYVIITYIVLNLLVAIIMENFSLFYSNEEDALLSYNDIRNFQNTWNIVDVNQRGIIPVVKVKFILRLLRGRLEVDMSRKDRLLFKHMVYELERVHNGDDVTFHDVLNMLSYRSVDIDKALQVEELLARRELEYIIEEEVAKQTIRSWLDACLKKTRAKEREKEHVSLLDGLRATNEPAFFFEDKKDKDLEQPKSSDPPSSSVSRPRERKKGMVMVRTDSLTSITGTRKFLTPSVSTDTRVGEKKNDVKQRKRGLAGSKPSADDGHNFLTSLGGSAESPSSPGVNAEAMGSQDDNISVFGSTGVIPDTGSGAGGASSEGGTGITVSSAPSQGTYATSTSMADVLSYRTCLPKGVCGAVEVRDWWREQVGYESENE